MVGQATHSSRAQGSLARQLFPPPPPKPSRFRAFFRELEAAKIQHYVPLPGLGFCPASPQVSKYSAFFAELAAGDVQPQALNPLAAPFQPAAQQAPAGAIPAAPSAPREPTASFTCSWQHDAGETGPFDFATLPKPTSCCCPGQTHHRELNPAALACRFVPYEPCIWVNDYYNVGLDFLTEEQAFETWRRAGFEWLPYNAAQGMTLKDMYGPMAMEIEPVVWEENMRYLRYVNAMWNNRGRMQLKVQVDPAPLRADSPESEGAA